MTTWFARYKSSLVAISTVVATTVFVWWYVRSDGLTVRRPTRAERKAERKQLKKQERDSKQRRKNEHAERQLALMESAVSAATSSTLIAVDVEAYEGDPSLVTEIGLACCSVMKGVAKFKYFRHLIIEEHLKFRNGRHVADNRDNFVFGHSEVLPLERAVQAVSNDLNHADYIIGHSVQGDIDWLRSIGVAINFGPGEVRQADTQVLGWGRSLRARTGPPHEGAYATQCARQALLLGTADNSMMDDVMERMEQVMDKERAFKVQSSLKVHRAMRVAHMAACYTCERGTHDPSHGITLA